jgi:phosphatidate cytidylyltransferase
MLRTRLWMGAVLVALMVGVLVIDDRLHEHFLLVPGKTFLATFPFLHLVVTALALLAARELRLLLDEGLRPPAWLFAGGAAAVVISSWVPYLVPGVLTGFEAWELVAGTFAAVVLSAFLWEMAVYREPGRATLRLALLVWGVAYLGLLPSFLVQLRWLPTTTLQKIPRGTLALSLAVFVPKFCDVGAYFTGRFLGRHKATPVLSPNKTWEGFAGGLVAAVLTALGIHALGPVFPGAEYAWLSAVAFGVVVGVVGALGDLAESMIKRDCQKKDASAVVPGFGGVLDVVDSIVFAAPVVYWWLK